MDECSHSPNERIDMLRIAFELICTFRNRTQPVFLDGGDCPKPPVELSLEELSAYKSILAFVKKEFGRGWRDDTTGHVEKDPPPDEPEKKPVRS